MNSTEQQIFHGKILNTAIFRSQILLHFSSFQIPASGAKTKFEVASHIYKLAHVLPISLSLSHCFRFLRCSPLSSTIQSFSTSISGCALDIQVILSHVGQKISQHSTSGGKFRPSLNQLLGVEDDLAIPGVPIRKRDDVHAHG